MLMKALCRTKETSRERRTASKTKQMSPSYIHRAGFSPEISGPSAHGRLGGGPWVRSSSRWLVVGLWLGTGCWAPLRRAGFSPEISGPSAHGQPGGGPYGDNGRVGVGYLFWLGLGHAPPPDPRVAPGFPPRFFGPSAHGQPAGGPYGDNRIVGVGYLFWLGLGHAPRVAPGFPPKFSDPQPTASQREDPMATIV